MPQPVTLSIAMGAQSPNVDDDDGTKNVASSPSKKNNESPSQPPQPQGQEDVLSSSAPPPPSIPSSFSEMKTPISVGVKLETKATTTLASGPNPIAPVVHRCDVTKAKAKAAPIKRTKKKAKPKNNARKIKSTTPKNKVPSSNNDDHDYGGDYDYDARPAEIKQPSLPTPPRDGKQSSSSSNKDNDMGEKRAVGTSAKMTSASPRWHNEKFALPLQKKETVHPPTTNNNNSKSSSSRSKISKDSFLSTTTTTVGEGEKEGGEPPKKRTKKSTSTSKEKVNHNQINSSSSSLSSSTTTSKKQSCSSKSKQGIKGGDDGDDSNNNNNNISKSKSSSQNNFNSNLRGNKFKARVYSAPSIADNSHLKKVVNAVIDMVADEIRYCASVMFGPSSPSSTERANDNEVILPRHKVTSSSSSSRAGEEALSSSLSSSSSSLRPTTQTKPVGSLKKPSVDDLSLASSSEGKGIRSVNISAEDTIHPTHNNNGTTTCSSSELGDQGTPSKKNRITISKRKLPQKQQHPQQQGPPSNNSQTTTTTQHDVRTAILAVRHFVSKIYLPHLLSAKKRTGNNNSNNNNNASSKGSSSPDTDRIRISTLLAIREMLILNAEKLFAFRDPSSSFHFEQGRRHPSKSSSSSSSTTSSSSVDREERRERIRLSHVFANAIVRNAVKRFRMRQPQVVADFARAVRNYDDRSEDFRFSLMQADVQSTTFAYNNYHPQGGGGGGGGGGVDREESVLARVSFNYARVRHPLMMCSNDTATPEMLALGDGNDGDVRGGMAKNENNNWPVHPMPTACDAFHIEPNTVSVTSEDDTDVLESFRTLLRSKRVAL